MPYYIFEIYVDNALINEYKNVHLWTCHIGCHDIILKTS